MINVKIHALNSDLIYSDQDFKKCSSMHMIWLWFGDGALCKTLTVLVVVVLYIKHTHAFILFLNYCC